VKKVQGMGLQSLRKMKQSAQLGGGWREVGRQVARQHIHRLGPGQMMAHRADTAQALHEHRHLGVGSLLDKFFEAAEFDDVQAGLLHLAVLIEQQGDLAVALHPGDRVYGIAGEPAGLLRCFQVSVHCLFSPVTQSKGIRSPLSSGSRPSSRAVNNSRKAAGGGGQPGRQ